jgi:hypothetical protein
LFLDAQSQQKSHVKWTSLCIELDAKPLKLFNPQSQPKMPSGTLTESELASNKAMATLKVHDGPTCVDVGGSTGGLEVHWSGGQSRNGGLQGARSGDQAVQLKGYPLGMILEACPDIVGYAKGGISSCHDFMTAADLVRKILGISPSAWEEAQLAMGREAAAIVATAMLQKAETINSAGGFLRNLTEKARGGRISVGPMLMALIRSKHAAGNKRRA